MQPSTTSISQYLSMLSHIHPTKKLLGDLKGWLTASQVFNLVQNLASSLLDFGIHQGSIVALRMERNTDTALMLLGLRFIGAVAVLTDPHADPETILKECSENIPVEHIISRLGESRFLIHKGGTSGTLRLNPEKPEMQMAPLTADSSLPGYVIFTSGSTGKTKAVVLSDYNLVNNLIDSQPLGDYKTDDIALGALPLEHVFGLVLLAGTVVLGYSLYLPAHTDIASILASIDQEQITRMNGVPSLYWAMVQHREGYDLSSLRAGFIGGAPVTGSQFMKIEHALGMTLIPVYGMSECIGICCADYRSPSTTRSQSVGKFYSMNKGFILSEDGTQTPAGQIGEICVTGPSRMWGYWGQPMLPGELIHTGDLGFLDAEGNLHISGRKKELIIRNGRNITPQKIENALLSLPGVEAAAVIGLPDEQAGEVPYAMVCGIVDPAQLRLLLPKNELPVGIMCVEQMPITASGKPDKMRIREVLKAWKNG